MFDELKILQFAKQYSMYHDIPLHLVVFEDEFIQHLKDINNKERLQIFRTITSEFYKLRAEQKRDICFNISDLDSRETLMESIRNFKFK